MAKSRDKSRRRRRGRKLSRMVTLRMYDAQALVDSIRKHKARVAAAWRERLAPGLREGETLPDHELELELRARVVEAAVARLADLDDRRDYARTQRGLASREVSRLAKQELYPHASEVRREIDAAFGREVGGPLHGFRGKTTRVAKDLMLRVAQLIPRLEHPESELPKQTRRGQPVEVAVWIGRLREPLDKLVAAEGNLRECQSTLTNLELDRKQAMKDYDALYADTLRIVEAELREAGLGERVLDHLRSERQQRRLHREAKRKREKRGAQPAASATAEAAEAAGEDEAPPDEATREASEGPIATVSKWLRKIG